MKDIIKKKFEIGKVPVCNKHKDRSPHIFGKCFILCWRCTMVMIFALLFSYLLEHSNLKFIIYLKSIKLGLLLIIPMIIDGYIQYFTKWNSTNFRRASTGALFGVGIAIITERMICLFI